MESGQLAMGEFSGESLRVAYAVGFGWRENTSAPLFVFDRHRSSLDSGLGDKVSPFVV